MYAKILFALIEILTGPKIPNTMDRKYRKIPARILVRVNLQATLLNEASVRPFRCTSSFHIYSTL